MKKFGRFISLIGILTLVLAATSVRPEVLEAMLPFFAERFGNPSAVYDLALGADDYEEWFVRHLVDPQPLIQKLAKAA